MNDLLSFFVGKKVLITGHTGFKGGWLSESLIQAGANVVGLSLEPPTSPNFFQALKLQNRLRHYVANICNFDSVLTIFEREKPEIVFHLAAQALVRPSYDRPVETIASNVLGTTHILEAIKKTATVRSALIVTTDKVYENKEQIWPYREYDALGGHDPYSASKAAADIISSSFIRSFFQNGPFLAIARAGNVIGGGDWAVDRLIPDIVRAIYEKKGTISLRNPKAIRPWEHVLEPICGYLMLAKKLYEGNASIVGAWNFGPEESSFLTVEEVVKKIDSLPYEIVPDVSKHEAKVLKLDITKSKLELGWQPKWSVDQAIKETFEWYDVYYNELDAIASYTELQIKKFFQDELFEHQAINIKNMELV